MMDLGKHQLCAKFKVASPSPCINIRGNPKILGAPLAQGHPHFSSGCDFMMGLGNPKLCTKFEVASYSRYRNTKGEATNFGELP